MRLIPTAFLPEIYSPNLEYFYLIQFCGVDYKIIYYSLGLEIENEEINIIHFISRFIYKLHRN